MDFAGTLDLHIRRQALLSAIGTSSRVVTFQEVIALYPPALDTSDVRGHIFMNAYKYDKLELEIWHIAKAYPQNTHRRSCFVEALFYRAGVAMTYEHLEECQDMGVYEYIVDGILRRSIETGALRPEMTKIASIASDRFWQQARAWPKCSARLRMCMALTAARPSIKATVARAKYKRACARVEGVVHRNLEHIKRRLHHPLGEIHRRIVFETWGVDVNLMMKSPV